MSLKLDIRNGGGAMSNNEEKAKQKRNSFAKSGHSYSLDSSSMNSSSLLRQTLQDVQKSSARVRAQSILSNNEWIRRSTEKLASLPKLIVRTGSLRNRKIDNQTEDEKSGYHTWTEGGRGADSGKLDAKKQSYVVQSGCYLYSGSAFHQDSYMMGRRESLWRQDRRHSKSMKSQNRLMISEDYSKPLDTLSRMSHENTYMTPVIHLGLNIQNCASPSSSQPSGMTSTSPSMTSSTALPSKPCSTSSTCGQREEKLRKPETNCTEKDSYSMSKHSEKNKCNIKPCDSDKESKPGDKSSERKSDKHIKNNGNHVGDKLSAKNGDKYDKVDDKHESNYDVCYEKPSVELITEPQDFALYPPTSQPRMPRTSSNLSSNYQNVGGSWDQPQPRADNGLQPASKKTSSTPTPTGGRRSKRSSMACDNIDLPKVKNKLSPTPPFVVEKSENYYEDVVWRPPSSSPRPRASSSLQAPLSEGRRPSASSVKRSPIKEERYPYEVTQQLDDLVTGWMGVDAVINGTADIVNGCTFTNNQLPDLEPVSSSDCYSDVHGRQLSQKSSDESGLYSYEELNHEEHSDYDLPHVEAAGQRLQYDLVQRFPKKKKKDLLQRMRSRVEKLELEQLQLDQQISDNEELCAQISNELSLHGTTKEVNQFILHSRELESISILTLGLARRLALLEKNMDNATVHSDLMYYRKKRDKLVNQMEEARWLQEKMDKRAANISESLERYSGVQAVLLFQEYISEKIRLVTEGKEVAEKLKLCRKQLRSVEESHWTSRDEDSTF